MSAKSLHSISQVCYASLGKHTAGSIACYKHSLLVHHTFLYGILLLFATVPDHLLVRLNVRLEERLFLF